MARVLMERGFSVLTAGTDCHLILVNVFEKGLTGQEAETALEEAGMACNKNTLSPLKRSPPLKPQASALAPPPAPPAAFKSRNLS